MPDDHVTMILDRLRRDGGRVTGPRRRVIEAMLTNPSHHLTAAEVVAAVRADDPDFYESTVYRTLDRLAELAVVERVQIGPGAAVFHLAHRPHHHLVCAECGGVTEVSPDVLDDIAEQVRVSHGFTLRTSASTLIGVCQECAHSRSQQQQS